MKEPATVKDEILNRVLESSSRQLEESAKNIEDIRSILHWAKSPRERTAINTILDDQKKVANALGRLVSHLSGMAGD
ncbi:MAG TPA: hypothetical protein VD736_08845 [Nitrososphaera sp.]|nr:hypothetical protein [Nitrososphaera sp.]